MSLFPLMVESGKATYTIDRAPDGEFVVGHLKLSCITTDNPKLVVSIVFPISMVLKMAHRLVEVSNRLEADTKTARMFHRPQPPWPADPFDDKEP